MSTNAAEVNITVMKLGYAQICSEDFHAVARPVIMGMVSTALVRS